MNKFTMSFKQIDNDVITTSSFVCTSTADHAYIYDVDTYDNYIYFNRYDLGGSGWIKNSPAEDTGAFPLSATNLQSLPESGTWYAFTGDSSGSIWTKCTEGTHDHLANIN